MSSTKKFLARGVWLLLIAAVLAVAGILGRAFWISSRTIFDLLAENKKLRTAIANLSAESQIGYAKVLSQATRDGRTFTLVLFVETARDDPAKHILEQEYEVEGDVVHFDALIVKFSTQYVADGRARALYLWRRVYGEKMTPESGYPIESAGQEPRRYAEALRALSVRDRDMFWTEIWRLAHDPERLKSAGVTAVFGNAVYTQMRPGFIYTFKIGNTGALSVEAAAAP